MYCNYQSALDIFKIVIVSRTYVLITVEVVTFLYNILFCKVLTTNRLETITEKLTCKYRIPAHIFLTMTNAWPCMYYETYERVVFIKKNPWH